MKKVLMSVVALLVAAMMLVSFAACGGDETPQETTTAPEVVEDGSTEAVDASVEESSAAVEESSAAEETSAVEESSAAVEESSAAAEEESSEEATEAPVAPTSVADIVALYNEATAKAVSAKPGYKKTVTTELQNLDMGAIGKLDMVRDAVGSFLGEGTETVTVAKGKASSEIVKSTLSASDVSSATCKLSADGKYYEVTINVKSETNPLKGKSSLNKFTNDYKDINEMHEGLASEGASAETITCKTTEAKIVAKIAVADKSFSALKYTIKIDTVLDKVNYVLTIKQGSGVIYTVVDFANFAY